MARALRKNPLRWWERLYLLAHLLTIDLAHLCLNLVTCVGLAALRRIPIRHYFKVAYNRFALARLSPREIQHLSPSTATIYRQWIACTRSAAQSRIASGHATPDDQYILDHLIPHEHVLSDGESSILWVGDRRRASKFVLFFHGGGYIAPMQDGHLEWCLRSYLLFSRARRRQGQHVAVAVLQYTLAPEARYPVQLAQAADALAYLLLDLGVRPRDLVIGGDSAGGNLASQIMSHLLHPHPDAREIALPHGERIAGVFAVSPWVSARTDDRSMADNALIDMLSPGIMEKVNRELLGNHDQYNAEKKRGCGWAMPADVDTGAWYKGLGKFLERLYVTVGTQEVFRDQSLVLAEGIRRTNPDIDVMLEERWDEAHDFILLEGGRKEDGSATRRMRRWVEGVFW
ncbi:Alpha/Beta hydrolase protein [Pseudoneurospora amorphoporcata]|uniref:Alpha/Beta hydrolase protein n=1 Tax=Pseudoneurospora amorphoporcata TaxID=241081 RepID=A0AAN6NN33_9PEZI|nr:Alpha/Beta hydrolase protein [Pseudoneurospora amorphoporcata]